MRTADRAVVRADSYDSRVKVDSSTLNLGFIVVRDDHKFPLGFAAAYTVTDGRYMLAPITSIDQAESDVYGVTITLGQDERVLTVPKLDSVVGMLIEFGMYIREATKPEFEAVDIFRQSRLYKTEAFWTYMWSGVGHFYSLVTIELPMLNMIILNDDMLRRLKIESTRAHIEPTLDPFEMQAAQYGHFIGMQIAIEELKSHDQGTIVMPSLAVQIFTNAKTRIVFPRWMNKTPE